MNVHPSFLRSPRRWRRQKGVGGVGGGMPPPPPPFSSFFPICGFSPERNSISCGKRRWVGTKKRREGEFIPLWCIYSPKRRAEVAIFFAAAAFFKKKKKERGGRLGNILGVPYFPQPKGQTDNSIHKWKIEKSSPRCTGNRSECSWVSIKKTKS